MGKIIKYILSFILMICIILSILIGIVSNTIASKEYCLKKLDEISFYDRTEGEIKNTFLNYILQSGMDESVFENIFDKEKLKQDIQILIDAIYEGKEIKIETESVKTKLTQNIDNYLKENKLNVNNRAELNTFIDTIVNTYENGIVYSMSLMKQVTPLTAKAINLIQKVKPIIYIATVVLLFILIIINLKIKADIAKYIGISMFSSGIILSIIKIFITSKININNITIANEVVTDFIHVIANELLNTILYFGIGIGIIGLILMVIKIISIKDEKKQKRKSKH